jgi:hypothetical protein
VGAHEADDDSEPGGEEKGAYNASSDEEPRERAAEDR